MIFLYHYIGILIEIAKQGLIKNDAAKDNNNNSRWTSVIN